MRFFVLGGSGLFGSFIIPWLRNNKQEVLAPTHQNFDVLDRVSCSELISQTELWDSVDIVINAVGYTDVGCAEKDEQELYLLNSNLFWLTDIPEHIRVVHLSTDYVYDGNIYNSKETDALKPFNRYGVSKAMGDMYLSTRKNTTIIRTSFKPSLWKYPCAFDDMYTNADYIDIIGDMIGCFILHPDFKDFTGIWNIGTPPKTMYYLIETRNPEVKRASVSTCSFLRPDVTMDLSKYRSIL